MQSTSRPGKTRVGGGFPPRRGWFLLAFGLGVGTTLLVQHVAGPEREARARGKLSEDAFHAAVEQIVDRHVDPVDETSVYARGLKHMAAGLDPHSHYLTRRERRRLDARAREGVSPGLALHFERDPQDESLRVEVAAVREGSPAASRGLHPGDVVLEIRGRDVAALASPAEAEALLTGHDGESVDLLVQKKHTARPDRVSLTLQKIADRKLVRSRLRHGATPGDPVYGIIEIRAFEAGVGDEVKRGLAELASASRGKLAGVVLDLRQNPGGEVDQALIVADLFIDHGVLTRTRGRGGVIRREETAHRKGTDASTKLVVLQDRYSASASELLAVALQEHGRAKVVGERSYGKGSVQEVIGLEDGSVLTLTTARYFSPLDRRIDGVGVDPDVPLIIDDDGTAGSSGAEVVTSEQALERAIAAL